VVFLEVKDGGVDLGFAFVRDFKGLQLLIQMLSL
jgi:hypothetical protein